LRIGEEGERKNGGSVRI